MNKREKGKQGEDIVKQHYEAQGFSLIEANFTVKGGEIDLLMRKEKNLVAIEVKNLDTVDELDNYITSRKVWHLQRALNSFLRQTGEWKFDEVRIDAVFVRNNRIIEIYENITNT